MTTTVSSTKQVGAAGYTLDDFHFTGNGTLAKAGATDAGPIVITNGVVDNAYRLVDDTDNAGAITGLTVRNVTGHFRRGFVKVRGARNILIEDCHGIGQGDAGTTESFPTGFQTENAAVDNLVIRRTIMEGFFSSDRTASYRNGDGFATEELVTNVLIEDCIGRNNADAGFDLKGQVKVVRCLSQDNHRSLRIWGKAEVTDFTSINPSNAHLWVGGGTRFSGATVTRMTFVGGSNVPHVKLDSKSGPGTLTLIDPVVPKGETLRIQKESGSQVTVVVKYTKDGGVVAARPNLDAGDVTPSPAPEPTPEPTPAPAPVVDPTAELKAALAVSQSRLAKAIALLAEIAAKSAKAPGGSSDKTAQIAALNKLASTSI